jgi:hypothetical protein
MMANYVLAFRSRADRTPPPGEDAAWGAWFGSLGTKVIDFGNRVGQVRTVAGQGAGEAGELVLSGYVVVSAESLDAAAELAAGCPGLKSGSSVEVGETVPA